jgi:ribosome biogenesis protein BRX1
VIYLEGRRRIAYLWIAHFPNGPSIKFLIQNLHSGEEMRLSGNCLRGSRPLLSFDASFKGSKHLEVIQQMLAQTFAIPEAHPKAMPFFDHVFSFSHSFGQVFFRNFEVKLTAKKEPSLVEIGPRFVLTIVKVLDGLVSGETLYKNGNFVPPRRAEIEREDYSKSRKKRKVLKSNGNPDEVNIYDLYGD